MGTTTATMANLRMKSNNQISSPERTNSMSPEDLETIPKTMIKILSMTNYSTTIYKTSQYETI
jgi:hypothetical protein